MTLYDNRPTHFFSATMRFHGPPNDLFAGLLGDAGAGGRRIIFSLISLTSFRGEIARSMMAG